MKMENDAWYFAYGSNLSTQRMQERIGRVPEARRARLDGYRLVFNKRGTDGTGKANVVADRHGTVWGVAYRCTAAEMRQLDQYEGVSSGHYRRRTVRVRDERGAEIKAIIYMAGRAFVGPALVPSNAYLQLIVAGAREHHLPEEYCAEIEAAARTARRDEDRG